MGGPDPESCDQFRPLDAPEGVLVMIQEGVLTRITVTPHKYWEAPARYVTVWSRPPSESEPEPRGIRYEIDAGDRVVHVHGGGPSIEYVEGCL